MKLNKIEQQFAQKGIIHGGIFLLEAKDAIDFIDECQKQHIRLLGVDAFYLTKAKIQPSLEHSVDFTASLYHEENLSNYDVARKIIDAAKDMYFEIVIDC